MRRPLRLTISAMIFGFAAVLLLPAAASAHFLWLDALQDKGNRSVHLYFSESAEPDDPDLLDRVSGVKVWQMTRGGKVTWLATKKGEESIIAKPVHGKTLAPDVFGLAHTYGVITRGESTFLLKYYAKTFSPAAAAVHVKGKKWSAIDCSKQLMLDVVPHSDGQQVTLQVLWKGKPLPKAELKIEGPGIDDEIEAVTNAEGEVKYPWSDIKTGLYSIRAKYVEESAGELNGKKYASIRHYSTLALRVGDASKRQAKTEPPNKTVQKLAVSNVAQMPEGLTSFGAAIVGDWLYVYGGHKGRAHSYSIREQSNAFRRLNLKHPGEWEKLPSGPRLQGLAMVADGGQIYRMGGFTARNKQGDDHDLWSQAGCARFDPQTRQWRELPKMPAPRSSHDAVAVGGKIYIAGGWALRGSEESQWHDSALVLDLSKKPLAWQQLPTPPFQRRALSLGENKGRVYAIGGMQSVGGPSTGVDVFDPAANKWLKGPSLKGDGLEGFGTSAFSVAGHLYVSTIKGHLQRLNDRGDAWETVTDLAPPRFFHRMLPSASNGLLLVGGANMSTGKVLSVQVVNLSIDTK